MAKGNICEVCLKNEATALFKGISSEKKVCVECKGLCEAWEKNNPFQLQPIRKLWDSLENLKQAKAEMEPYLQKPKLIESFGKSCEHDFNMLFGISKELSETNNPYCEQVRQALGLNDKEELIVAPDGKTLMINFKKEEALRTLEVLIKAYNWRINELTNDKPNDIPKPNPSRDKDDPNRKPDKPNEDKPKSDEICERCKKSCKKLVSDDKVKGERTYRIAFKQITCYRVDFVKEIHYFGTDCPCAEQFKLEHHWTCPQCQKRDWPDLKKNWVLDYEIKNCFCSAKCHVEYRQMKWEEAHKLTQVELPTPELEISINEGQNTDWEKEGLKREVLYWREYAKSLEQRLNNQTNLTPEERQQADYLRNLQQNTLRNAEDNYRSRYGELTEDGSDNKGKGLSGGMIALIVIGGIVLVVGIIFLLTRGKKRKSKIKN